MDSACLRNAGIDERPSSPPLEALRMPSRENGPLKETGPCNVRKLHSTEIGVSTPHDRNVSAIGCKSYSVQ